MKLIHISDLHIGKRVNEFSLLEDQTYILGEITHIIKSEVPDAVMIAGDVYDKAVPSAEAVAVFDNFLTELAALGIHVFIISGNHDSPERLAFGAGLMHSEGVHIAPVFNGKCTCIELIDNFGSICIYMLPYIKPASVRQFYADETLDSYQDATACVLSKLNCDLNKRNILLAHQFVTGASRCESEDITVGGLDNISSELFDRFDYVALGHIHCAQSIKRTTLRYCGTPLKYSFSEAGNQKSVTVVELGRKGDMAVRTVPLEPLRDMREIKGLYSELTSPLLYNNTRTNDYLHVTLTDEYDIPDAIGRLRSIYPNIMKLDYDNMRTASAYGNFVPAAIQADTPEKLFAGLYKLQNNSEPDAEQLTILNELLKKVRETNI